MVRRIAWTIVASALSVMAFLALTDHKDRAPGSDGGQDSYPAATDSASGRPEQTPQSS